MERRYFSEIDPTGRVSRPYSIYNIVPTRIVESERNSCDLCNYRRSMLKEEFVTKAIGFLGLSTKNRYEPRDRSYTPNCNRRRCRLDKELLVGRY